MLKFTADMPEGGRFYGFGLSEPDLNRLQFNKEPIFFNFGYDGHPELFGLIFYVPGFKTAQELFADLDLVKHLCVPFIDPEHGVTPESLRIFPFTADVMEKFRAVPLWGFETNIEIADSKDIQTFFSGRTGKEMEDALRKAGVIIHKPKPPYKGFGARG